jgi:hypothetical protein
VRIRTLIASLLLAALLLTATAGPASATVNSTYRWRLFLAINEVRANHGLAPVHLASGLRNAAQAHSNDMVSRNYFAHTSPTGSTLCYRIMHSTFDTYGAWWAGENLAWHGHDRLATQRDPDVAGQPGAPRHPALLALHLRRHRSHGRPVPGLRKRGRVDGRLRPQVGLRDAARPR